MAEKDHDRKIIEVFEKVSDLLLDLTTRGARHITCVARVICRAPRLDMLCPTTQGWKFLTKAVSTGGLYRYKPGRQ